MKKAISLQTVKKTNSIARDDWWLEKPENIYLRENFRKKEKEYEDRKINWSGTQVRQEIEHGYSSVGIK